MRRKVNRLDLILKSLFILLFELRKIGSNAINSQITSHSIRQKVSMPHLFIALAH